MNSVLVGLIGVLLGGMITSFFQYYFGFRKEVRQKEFSFKEVRYKAIVMFLYAKLYPETIPNITLRRPELKNADDIDEELNNEFLNAYLFASDDVLKTLHEFLKRPTQNSLISAILAMRKDLWGRKTKISEIFLIE